MTWIARAGKNISSANNIYCSIPSSKIKTEACFTQRKSYATPSNQYASVKHYKILGISRNASEKEIKEAYHKLAMKYHPDKNRDDKNALKKFQEISSAYEYLSNQASKNSEGIKHSGNYSAQYKNYDFTKENKQERRTKILFVGMMSFGLSLLTLLVLGDIYKFLNKTKEPKK